MKKIEKIVELVTIADRLDSLAEQETLVMEGYITELDQIIAKYDQVLHVHDMIAILANTQLALQLVHCIDLGDGE